MMTVKITAIPKPHPSSVQAMKNATRTIANGMYGFAVLQEPYEGSAHLILSLISGQAHSSEISGSDALREGSAGKPKTQDPL
jgi:hypothetical protein